MKRREKKGRRREEREGKGRERNTYSFVWFTTGKGKEK